MNNQQVAHAWAHGHAGKGSNLRSDGIELTSYSTTIAKTVDGVHFISLDNMTPTTSKHLNYARRAVSYQYFASPGFDMNLSWPDLSAAGLIKAAAERAQADIERIFSSKSRQATKLAAAREYTARRDEILAMAARFDVKIIMPEYVASHEEIAGWQERKAAERAAAEAVRLKAQKRQRKEDAKQFKIWLTTGAGRCPSSFIERGSDFITIAGHRTDGDGNTLKQGVILTSQGAGCPLDHAVKALRVYRAVMLAATNQDAADAMIAGNGVVRLGMFKLDSIDITTGVVCVGCHTFSAKTISAFLNQWREVLGI